MNYTVVKGEQLVIKYCVEDRQLTDTYALVYQPVAGASTPENINHDYGTVEVVFQSVGKFGYQIWRNIEGSNLRRKVVQKGIVTVEGSLEDPATATDLSNETILEALRAQLAGVATQAQKTIVIGNMTLVKLSPETLITTIQYYERLINRAKRGRGRVYVRFTRQC